MAYTPFLWKANQAGGTPVSAVRLNAIEQGIAAASLLNTAYFYNVHDFGAAGDGSTDDTAAVQAAITAALAASDPIQVQDPKWNGKPVTVYFPKGEYSVNTLHIPGSLRLVGESNFAYGSATLRARTAGQSILSLEADTDGTSNASVIEDLCFRAGFGTSDPNAALIKTALGIGSNSLYIRRCWFATPERYAIWITQGDDIKILDCTFDVSAFHCIKLGYDATHGCSNVQIAHNTFYDIALRVIDLINVDSVSITANKAYKGTQSQASVFVETADATSVKGVTITANTIGSIKIPLHLFAGKCRNVVFSSNIVRGNFDNALLVEGASSDILQGLVLCGNSIDNSNAMDGGSAFRCQTAQMQACIISHNSVIVQNATPLVFNMPGSGIANNVFNSNIYINFSALHNFANAAANAA